MYISDLVEKPSFFKHILKLNSVLGGIQDQGGKKGLCGQVSLEMIEIPALTSGRSRKTRSTQVPNLIKANYASLKVGVLHQSHLRVLLVPT